jgi:hypothetical protein
MDYITHPWLIASWPTVHCAVTQRSLMIRRLRCISARLNPAAPGQLRSGQVLWACRTPIGDAGLAWDWFEIRRNVVAIADPMHVLSNLRFVDSHGVELPQSEGLLELNNVVAGLDWQGQIEPAVHDIDLLRAA